MNIAGKDLKDYIKIITLPLCIIIVAAIIQGVVDILGKIGGLLPPPLNLVTIFTGIVGWIISLVMLAVFIVVSGWVGWNTVKKYSGTLINAFIAGMMFGFAAGLIDAVVNTVLNIISLLLNINPLGMAFGLVTIILLLIAMPILGLIIAGICAAIGGLLAGGKT